VDHQAIQARAAVDIDALVCRFPLERPPLLPDAARG